MVKLPFLEHLDISANGLQGATISQFLKMIDKKNQLRSLNISTNSCKKNGSELSEQISKFLHYSDSLIHFDMSSLGLAFPDYLHIAEKGLRKSKTLLSAHMSGMGLLTD